MSMHERPQRAPGRIYKTKEASGRLSSIDRSPRAPHERGQPVSFVSVGSDSVEVPSCLISQSGPGGGWRHKAHRVVTRQAPTSTAKSARAEIIAEGGQPRRDG